MPARVTKEVLAAIEMLRGCQRTPYSVAKELGISTSTIYRSKHYKELIEELAKEGKSLPTATVREIRVKNLRADIPKIGRRVHASPEVEAAVDKIIATGLIPPKVAPEFGVSHSSIYRNPRYKAWKAAGSVKIAKRTSKRSESHQDTNAGVVPEVTTQVEGIADAA